MIDDPEQPEWFNKIMRAQSTQERASGSAPLGGSVARFRIEGAFVGGCDWESNQIFKNREAAEFVMAQWKETDVTKSKNYRVVEVPLNDQAQALRLPP